MWVWDGGWIFQGVGEEDKYDQNLMYKILKQLIIYMNNQNMIHIFQEKKSIKLKIIITVIKIKIQEVS